MKKKLVSIALTTYNGAEYLHELLESIYNQTYQNIEIIACDDCSSDDSVKILEKFKNKLNITILKNEGNIGYLKNFQKSINLCTGEYIALADQDDIWFPEKIEILLDEIGSNSLICSDAVLINKDGSLLDDSFIKYSNLYKDRQNLFETLVFKNFVLGCTILFERNLVSSAFPMPENENSHDNWLGIMAYKGRGLKFCDKKLIKYRQHSNNTVGAVNKSYFIQILHSFFNREDKLIKEKMVDSLIKKYKDRLEMNQFNKNEMKIISDAFFFYTGYKEKQFFNPKWIRVLLRYKQFLF